MKYITVILTLLTNAAYSQCDELVQRFELPIEYSAMDQLTPDPCHGTNNYGTQAVLRIAPEAGYLERKLKIQLTTITEWDAIECVARTISQKMDTFTISEVRMPQKSNVTTGGYYTCRLELMVTPPISAPPGCVSTRLPSTHQFAGYWLTTYGQFDTIEEARRALKKFKAQYPEYCSSFPYFVPQGCDMQFTYQSNTHNEKITINDSLYGGHVSSTGTITSTN